MEKNQIQFGQWEVACFPDDGARISILKYNGFDLLTGPPSVFRSPSSDYGEYELRPVYGYDDCFPSVSACTHPTKGFSIRDHGDVCWQKWQVETQKNQLICKTGLYQEKIKFIRRMIFEKNSLDWKFEIINNSSECFEFLHVVHPLMPLKEIAWINLPEFENIYEEAHSRTLKVNSSEKLNEHLLNINSGDFEMLFLNKTNDGNLTIQFKNNLKLNMLWDSRQFPTLGIWWNNNGYPVENGIKRNECAFEPVPGNNSNLLSTYKEGKYLSVLSKQTFQWTFQWKIID